MTDFLLSSSLAVEEEHRFRGNRNDQASSCVAEEIEELSRHFVDMMNARNYTDPRLLDCIAPDFHGNHDRFPAARSWDQLVEHHHKNGLQFPDVKNEVINTSVQVHDRHAKVFAFILTTGYPDGIRRQTMSVFRWQRRQHKWMLLHTHSIGSVYPGRARLFEERVISNARLPEAFENWLDEDISDGEAEEEAEGRS